MSESVTFDIDDKNLTQNIENGVNADLQRRAALFAEEVRFALESHGIVVAQVTPLRVRIVYPRAIKTHVAFVIDGAMLRNALILSEFKSEL
jgi:hypothetical protein